MIYTRFGTEVTLLTVIDDEGFLWVDRHDDPDGTGFKTRKEYHISDLRADEGIAEILAASTALHSDDEE
jgi:hypothetical protein